MALPDKLKQARMTDATLGSSIDDKVGELEQALADILGIPIDTDIAKAVLGAVDSEGRITSPLRLYHANSNASTGAVTGVRIRDENGGSSQREALITVENGQLRIYDNTGTEASPTWTERTTISLTSGYVDPLGDFISLEDTPAAFLSSHKFRAVTVNGSYNAVEFGASLGVSGSFSLTSATNATAVTVAIAGSPEYDPQSMISGNQVIVPATGLYLIAACYVWAADAGAAGVRQIQFIKNGSWDTEGGSIVAPPSTSGFGQTASMVRYLSSGDDIAFDAYQNSGSALDVSGSFSVTLLR